MLILLHYLPRFQAAPPLSDAVERITGGAATSLDAFVETELRRFFTASTSYGTTTV